MALYEQFPVSIHNTLERRKVPFEPLDPPHVGLYVCGPTVYGPPHLGHARSAIIFDVVRRYLGYLGYRVRYVRNITDVGHLEDDVGEQGEDKISKQARLDRVEPMEIAQTYTLAYHRAMERLGTLPPNIEPSATGHIPEQIEFVERILENGYAYAVDGSVYFDLEKYAADRGDYGRLSGKVLEDLVSGSRTGIETSEKRGPLDFALWKKAEPQHLMRWRSPWGEGFPGWHIECSVMSTRYLGETFDIHGGGMDIQFPHHEAEIAQSVAALGHPSVRYWMHHNMLTIAGQKMAKSAGNYITVEQMFSGDHPLLEQPYSPMTIRFFMLQTHYRAPIDFSNEPLQAAEKGLRRLLSAAAAVQGLDAAESGPAQEERGTGTGELDTWINELLDTAHRQLSDDFNTPQAIATLFDIGSRVQALRAGELSPSALTPRTVERLRGDFAGLVGDVLGLVPEREADTDRRLDAALQLLIAMRAQARERRDWAAADAIRDRLREAGIRLEDTKEGTTYVLE